MNIASLRDLAFRELSGRLAADPLPDAPASGISVRAVRVEAQERTPHRHPHSAEIIYVVAGAGEHWQDGARRSVSQHDAILVPAGVPHVTLAEVDKPLLLLCFFPHPDLSQNTEELTAAVQLGSE